MDWFNLYYWQSSVCLTEWVGSALAVGRAVFALPSGLAQQLLLAEQCLQDRQGWFNPSCW